MTIELRYVQTAHIFVADGTWFIPPNLLHVVAIIRSGGGGSRGGGGAAITTPKIFRIQLDEFVPVTVGAGGTSGGTPGGESSFGDYVIPGGDGTNGAGALAPVGRGGDSGYDGESVTGTPITLLAGGGGGGRVTGGSSGLVKSGQTVPFPYTNNSGAGGSETVPAGWPAGGGGTGRPGAGGCVTVLATTWIEVE